MGYEEGYGYGQPMMEHAHYFHPLVGAFWALVILAIIVFAIRHRRGKHWGRCGGHGHHGALGTLRERYAKGEISTAEYEERKKALLAD